ncbi:ATP-binding protein [Metabacillus endolithicus]|uniref:histidine kinase n=2 Tax=Metabacillus endolithicus TaxID=1535204 RepID=A0ABW5C3F5_9BACI|nr:ATP-binding protein [Metabacillus endolithicus]UPG62556.1 ATP-binding protein [Metabacillus endolithicus]
MKKINSLRFKWMILILSVTSIALIILGTSNYIISKNNLMERLEGQYLTLIINSSKNLQDWLNIRYQEANILQDDPILRNGTLDEKLKRLNEPSITKDKHTLGIADLEGNMTLLNGEVIDVSMRENYNRALNGEISWSEPFISLMDERSIFTLYVPLYDENNKIHSLIGFAFSTEEVFRTFLQSEDVPEAIHVQVINSKGELAFNRSAVYNQQPENSQYRFLQNEAYTSLLNNGQGYIHINEEEFTGTLFYKQLIFTDVTDDRYIIYLVPEEIISKPLKDLFFSTITGLIITEILLGFLIYIISSRLIINRLKTILETTEKVANGFLKVSPIDVKGKDELSQIASSVNKMTETLINLFEPFETIISNNEYAMIVTDKNLDITNFNTYAEILTGYSSSDVVGQKNLLDFLCPEEVDLRGGRNNVIELILDSHHKVWTVCDKKCSKLPTELNSNKMVSQDGKLKGYVFLAKDISNQINQRVTTERLLSIVENAKDYIVSFNSDGEILYFNKALLKALNEVSLGKKRYLKDYISVSTQLRVMEGLKIAAEQGYYEVETEITSVEGKSIDASIVMVSHKRKESNETFYSAIIRDISVLKEAHRKQEIAIHQVQEANQAKSLFLAKMSHEIRTPLNGVIGLSEILKSTNLQETQKDYVDKILLSSRLLLNLINDILDFSKIEAGKVVMVKKEFNLHEMIKRLSTTTGVLIDSKPVSPIFDVDLNIPIVLVGDDLKVEQVLMNLISNAIKFTEDGYITLEVRIKKSYKNELLLQFNIIDTGIGMTQEEINKLFKEFSQLDGSINRKYGGTGLGLIISKNFIEKMGGHLSVNSEKGKGSTFSFIIPFYLTPRKQVMNISVENATILLIEKDDLLRQNIEKMMVNIGTAISVSSWDQVEEEIKNNSFTHCLVDLDLDEIDMKQWKWLYQESVKRNIYTIGYTRIYKKERVKNQLEDRIPNALLTLPLNMIELYEAVEFKKGKEIAQNANKIGNSDKILVVEDNQINQEVISTNLKNRGYIVQLANNGQQALQILNREHGIALIIMDIHMPGMNGYETTAKIRELQGYEQIPVIAITADLTAFKDEKASLFHAFLSKPIDSELMFSTISMMLSNWDEHSNVIDWEEARNRLNGKEQILIKLLKSFETNNDTTVDRIRECIEQEDYEKARLLVHTLKGASANLSLLSVCKRVTQLEDYLVKRDVNMNTALLLLEESLIHAFDYINTL